MKIGSTAHQQPRLAFRGSRPSLVPPMMFVGLVLLASCLSPVQPTFTPPQPTATPFSTAVADEITVAASNVRIEGPLLAVDVCFNKPTEEDWIIETASLEFDTRQEQLFGATRGCAYGDPSCFISRMHCDTLQFRLTRPGIKGPSTIEHFTITISAIVADPQQGEICTQPFLDQLQSKLAGRDPRITVSTLCDEQRDLFLVTDKPEDMSLDEAQDIIGEVYLEVIGRMGPWVLEGGFD